MANDFTKEELILLASWSANRYDQVGSAQSADEGTIALSHKIQSMLVNYCDHEFEILSLMPHLLIKCDKCDKTFVDDSFPG